MDPITYHLRLDEMKSLMLFLNCILNDIGDRCCISTSRDSKTIAARVESEGISFLTITLTNFGSDLQKALDQGFVDPSLFAGFRRRSQLPVFLGELLDLVFDRCSGRLISDPSVQAIRAIRQLTLMFGKIELACSKERTDRAFQKFVDCEKELRISDRRFDSQKESDFRRIGNMLFSDVFNSVNRSIYLEEHVPGHGPGATADKLTGNDKWSQTEWTERLEDVFPMGKNVFSSWSEFLNVLSDLQFLEPGAERPVKVTAVPKTLKTPRMIAIEPTCMQYMQQAVRKLLYDAVDEDNLSRQLIGFNDQVPNQVLARLGSITGNLATLDLSEASDRVSNQHVRSLVRDYPHLAMALDATRSRKADVPGHGVIPLAKFASMGSALCFPMEAMVFATIIFYGIEKELKRPLNRRDINSLRSKVRVFGDDIVIPIEFVRSVVSSLEDFGLKVNAGKSYWTGKFRESCGKDYYDGHDVSIVKVRRMIPTQRKHVDEIVSTVSLRNQLFELGYWKAVEFLDSTIERFIPFPVVAPTSSALGKVNFGEFETHRFDPKFQRPMVKAAVISTRIPRSFLENYGALSKCLLKQGEEPFLDARHLERAGRPGTVDIKTRWTYSY